MSSDYVEQIKRLQKFGRSFEEAKKEVEKNSILRALGEARNFYELRALVRTIAEKVL